MYHLRLKGSHYDMGVKRGKIIKRGQITFPLHLDAFQLEHGKQSEKIIKKFFPEVCEEIKGVSDTIGADYLKFISWMLCMGCCMYNLEENIPTEVRGCTAFAYSKGGRIIYGRNNDLPPIYVTAVQVISIPRKMETDLLLRHLRLLMEKKG